MRSVVELIEVAIVTVATLVVAAVLFALAIGQEHVCHGIAEVTERGVSVPSLLVGYCT